MMTSQVVRFVRLTGRVLPYASHANLIGATLIAGLLLLSGCSSTPESKPTVISARVNAAMGLNADARKRASPVIVRIYQLSDRSVFDTADFVSLYARDKETLGAALISREEWVLRPGETRDWNPTTTAETKFIGVLAAYREIERARWRSTVMVKPSTSNNLLISLDALGVNVTVLAPTES